MVRSKIVVTIAAFLFSIGGMYAQEPVSLQDAIQYTLKNSEVVKQARLDIDKVAYKVNETRGSALPQINFTSSVTNNVLVQQFVLPAETFGGPPGEYMAMKIGQPWNAMSQVQLSQQVYNQQLFLGMKAARNSVEFYELAAKVSEENVIQQVSASFYQVVVTREKIKVISANLERMKQLEKVVQGQYESGLAKKIDLDRILVNISNVETQELQLKNQATLQENLLKYYMGMPMSQQIVLQYESVEKMGVPSSQMLGAETLNTSNLVSLQVLKKQEQLLILDRKAKAAEGFPSLSLNGNYTLNTQSGKLNLYSKKALNYDMANVNLTLRVPIFDGLSRRARVKQAAVEIEKHQENIRQSNNGMQMNFDNAREQINNSLRAISNQQENKKLAEEVFYSTQHNYQNGLASLTDLLNAETELSTAQNSYNEALLNYKIAEIDYIKAKGEIKSLLNQ
jgi:outer membrane protein